jgi:fatty acid desaturase
MHDTHALRSLNAPSATSLHHLRPSDTAGAGFTVLAAAMTMGGAWLAASGGWAGWVVGELLLAMGLVMWFVLLHECGHRTLFRNRRLNHGVGFVAGFFAMIPFGVWRRVHQRHHKWTGWQDLDPTTEALVPRPLGRVERLAANICWRWWIPLFAVLYRANNFWNLPRLWRLFPDTAARRDLARSLAALTAAYAAAGLALAAWLGPATAFLLLAPAVTLSFMAEDVLLVSQHTHVPMLHADGRDVRPFPSQLQEPFTRSLRLPALASWLTLHFDKHELHHMYPAVPGYRLSQVPYVTANEVSWRRWIPAARAVPGAVLLFQNRHDTGLDL